MAVRASGYSHGMSLERAIVIVILVALAVWLLTRIFG
jgi:hypothetical protein